MDGEAAWDWYKGADEALRLRSRRLNVRFKGTQEPALDAVHEIDHMAEEARSHRFFLPDYQDAEAAIVPRISDAIEEVALRFRASLFFFEPGTITYNDNKTIAIVKGHIHSRLDGETDASQKLIAHTENFRVGESVVDMPTINTGVPLKVPVSFQHEVVGMEEKIRIDAKFRTGGYLVPISGCPVSLKTLKKILET
ncbi:Nn.00g024770.m01.CDS01 [Neocucurbitaria sp. VM-36]